MANTDLFYRIIAFGLCVLYFTLVPTVLRELWPKIVDLLRTDWRVYLYMIGGGSLVQFVGFAVLFQFLYDRKFTFFEAYRSQAPRQWVWERSDKDAAQWRALRTKTMLNNVLNMVTGLALVPVDLFVMPHELKYAPEDFPTIAQNLLHILVSAVVHDAINYWVHRILHHPVLYPWMHKIHHQYNQPVTISSYYFHPLEFVTAFLLPGIAGRKVLHHLFGVRMHFVSFFMWECIGVFIALEAHCGYELPFSPMAWTEYLVHPSYHDFHHSHNIGTYAGVFTFWDTVMGTNKEYYEYRHKNFAKRDSIGTDSAAKAK